MCYKIYSIFISEMYDNNGTNDKRREMEVFHVRSYIIYYDIISFEGKIWLQSNNFNIMVNSKQSNIANKIEYLKYSKIKIGTKNA